MIEDDDITIDEFFVCQCMHEGHTLHLRLSTWGRGNGEPELEALIYLGQWQGFFRRCWVAFKYIFNIKPHQTHWDSWMLKPTDAARMELMLAAYLDMCIGGQKLLPATGDGEKP